MTAKIIIELWTPKGVVRCIKEVRLDASILEDNEANVNRASEQAVAGAFEKYQERK